MPPKIVVRLAFQNRPNQIQTSRLLLCKVRIVFLNHVLSDTSPILVLENGLNNDCLKILMSDLSMLTKNTSSMILIKHLGAVNIAGTC